MIKKIISSLIFLMMAQNVFAIDFNCRSYNTGKLLDYKEETRTLVYRDRFGNELDAWTPVDVFEINEEIMFYYEYENILTINITNQKALFSFSHDTSFYCRPTM